MPDAGLFFVCGYIIFALITGSISVAILVGNKASDTGSCCLPSSCNLSRISTALFRPPSVNGICSISSVAAELLGCPEAATDLIDPNCTVSDLNLCASLLAESSVRLTGILGVSSPFSPIIGLFIAGLALLQGNSGGNMGGFVAACVVLTTLAMYIATTVFAGISYYELRSSEDYPYHAQLAQRCTFTNSSGVCTEWHTSFFISNSSTQVCTLIGNASVYGGKITGNVRTPIAMLYFFPLVFFVGIPIALVVLVFVVLQAKRLTSNDRLDTPRNNQTFVAAKDEELQQLGQECAGTDDEKGMLCSEMSL